MQPAGEGTARLELAGLGAEAEEDMALLAHFESRLEEGMVLRHIRGQGRPRAHRNSAEVYPLQ